MCYQTVIDFLLSTASTVFGGVLLAVLFFISREKFFPLPKLTGRWNVEMRTDKTDYKPYKGMILTYTATILCEGPVIKGTAEKVYEKSSTGERPYIGKDTTRSEIMGYIDKRYFSVDRVSLHIVEDGHGRESTHFHELVVQKDGSLTGTFYAMVAKSEGEVTWQREPC